MGSLPHIVEELPGALQVYSDGTFFRTHDIKFPFPIVENDLVKWKDEIYDTEHDLDLRIYKPIKVTAKAAPAGAYSAKKLPILYYIHGGGFCAGSRTWPHFHNYCIQMAASLDAVIISVDHRLAPEHRLPAAFDDVFNAVKWLQWQKDEWLANESVDLNRVYIVGDSSGGNIAHNLAVRFGIGSKDLSPVCVRGYVLLGPFFGGVARTKSEAEGPYEEMINLDLLDRFWRLSLPIGESRDHPYSNPFGPESPNLVELEMEPLLIIVGGNEVMKDRIKEYANKMKEMKKKIEYVEFEGKQHGFFTKDPFCDISNAVLNAINRFVLDNSSDKIVF